MIGVTTTQFLTLLDQGTLKHPPPLLSPTHSIPSPPTSSFWSVENNAIFISSSDDVFQYDLSGNILREIYSFPADGQHIAAAMSKDRGSTIVVARGQEVHLLATQSRKIVQTFNTHKTAVKSISLSNDGTLLASVSSNAVHVHNLSLASHTVLRGLPVGNTISTCAFHPHSRTRLLLGSGTQFIIYDTTRPSGPSKTIAIDKDKSNPGSIVAIACSPFSKTLVSVACSGGMIGLVDLEKEKGLFKTLALPVPLTSLTFSPEGATIYVGTENGKLLILDLRSLDKPPKSINVSDNGDKVISLCVQRKLKSGETASKASTIAATKPLVQRDVNKNLARRTAADTVPEKNIATAAVKSRVGSIMSTVLSTGTPAKARLVSGTPRRTQARTASAVGATVTSPVAKAVSSTRSKRGNEAEPAKKPFSPPKSPLVKRADIADDQEFDLSVRIENLLAFPRTKENTSPPEATTGRAAPPSLSTALPEASARVRDRDTTKSRTRTRTISTSRTSAAISSVSSRLRAESGATSSISDAGKGSRVSARSRHGISSTSPVSRAPSSSAASRRERASSRAISRTPSPDLPKFDDAPATPIPGRKIKGKERAAGTMNVLGLGTPDVDRWIEAGEDNDGMVKREGRRVGFVGDDPDDDRIQDIDEAGANDDKPKDTRAELAMQVSPLRQGGTSSSSSGWAPVPSPLRNTSPQANSAQEFLQTMLRDGLYDFRRETRAEITGLHLDLLRMGRSWRKEMREAMGEWGADIRALREENERLREENERLRRGY